MTPTTMKTGTGMTTMKTGDVRPPFSTGLHLIDEEFELQQLEHRFTLLMLCFSIGFLYTALTWWLGLFVMTDIIIAFATLFLFLRAGIVSDEIHEMKEQYIDGEGASGMD